MSLTEAFTEAEGIQDCITYFFNKNINILHSTKECEMIFDANAVPPDLWLLWGPYVGEGKCVREKLGASGSIRSVLTERKYSKPSLIRLELIQTDKQKIENGVNTLKDTWRLERQMSYLPVQIKLDSIFKPSLLRSKIGTTNESSVDE
jgi:hypothetical protein